MDGNAQPSNTGNEMSVEVRGRLIHGSFEGLGMSIRFS